MSAHLIHGLLQPPGGATCRVRKPWDVDSDCCFDEDEEDEEDEGWDWGVVTADFGGGYHSKRSLTDGCLQLDSWQFSVHDDRDGINGGSGTGTSGSQGRLRTLAPLLKAVVPRGARLGRLALNECTLKKSTFAGCDHRLHRVHTLELENCRSDHSDKDFVASLDCLLRQTPRLRRLSIQGKDRRWDSSGGNVYGLGLSEGLPPALETELPQLTCLSITGSFVDAMPDGPYWAGLRHLDVSCSDIGDFPASLATATRLRSLRMENCYLNALSVEAAEMLAQLPLLHAVHLAAAEGVHYPGVELLASKRPDVKIT